jgi:primosomal protein N' (replication factor Y)
MMRKKDRQQLWLVPQPGEGRHQRVAEVAVRGLSQRLVPYALPDEFADVASAGSPVRVPIGRGKRVTDGLCVRISEQPWEQTRKPLLSAEPGVPWLSPTLVELGLWIGSYYVCSAWKTFRALLPAPLRKAATREVRYLVRTDQPVERRLTSGQAAVLAMLEDGERPRQVVLREAGVSAAVVNGLRKRGLIDAVTREESRPADELIWQSRDEDTPADRFMLTAAQEAALARITAHQEPLTAFRVFLLFGVPGSGKTEVYVRAIRRALAAGRQAILVIPEIALATQVVERLARRFPRVAVLHSQLRPRQRALTLHAIAAGQVDVVIGTRTAVFAPCPNLGLIVVDEEQEGSLKNLAAPFYHARDVAIKRGQLEDVPVVLGSATPALETWHNAQQREHYERLDLPDRVAGATVPTARAVLAPSANQATEGGLLAGELWHELEATVAHGHQAILLHNRRGYALYLRCEQCGTLVSCERCGAHLVFHQPQNVLKCHRCGWQRDVPAACPDNTCNGPLQRTGLAIQRLEEELRQRLPEVRLLRLDSDTMRKREQYEAALADFENGAADVMLGTQMVAKGLDFPRVRLVGVIDADAALNLPDFRASERVFQLLVQVVGRAGRREGQSLALVQTEQPRHPVITAALRQDYAAFASQELELRKRFFYPPYSRLVRLVLADPRPHQAQQAAQDLAMKLEPLARRISAWLRIDPAEACIVPRMRDMLRYQVLIRSTESRSLATLFEQARSEKLLHPRVQRFTIDVDAQNLL